MKEKLNKHKSIKLLVNFSDIKNRHESIEQENKLGLKKSFLNKTKPSILSFLYNNHRKYSETSIASKQSLLTNYTYLTQKIKCTFKGNKSQMSSFSLKEEMEISYSFHSSIVSNISAEPILLSENESSHSNSNHFNKNEI